MALPPATPQLPKPQNSAPPPPSFLGGTVAPPAPVSPVAAAPQPTFLGGAPAAPGPQQPAAAPDPMAVIMQALAAQAASQQMAQQRAAAEEAARSARQSQLDRHWQLAAQQMAVGTPQQMFAQILASEAPGWARRGAAPMRQSFNPMEFKNNKFRTVSPFANQRPLAQRGAGLDDEDAYMAEPSMQPFRFGA